MTLTTTGAVDTSQEDGLVRGLSEAVGGPRGEHASARPLDRLLTPAQLSHLSDLDDVELLAAAESIAGLERDLSASRHDLHRRIDRVQEELVGRYRSGASVDDLLR